MLLLITIAHLGVLIALFACGSGPMFVQRIVLFHFALLLPIPAAMLVQLIALSRRSARRCPRFAPVAARVAAILVCGWVVMRYGTYQTAWAGRVFRDGWFCDHANVREPYTQLGTWLGKHRKSIAGRTVIEANDHSHIVDTVASLPRRVRSISSPEDAPVLGQHGVVVFVAATRDLGRGYSNGAVERAFLRRNAHLALHQTNLGPWRIYEISPGP